MFENHMRVIAKLREPCEIWTSHRFRGNTCLVSTPTQRPEGRLLERLRTEHRPPLSGRAAAKAAGISPSRWTQIIRGYKQETPELRVPVRAPADTLARMARAVGATPAQLREAGREDAADELERSVPVNTAALPKHGVQRLRDTWAVVDDRPGEQARPSQVVLPASRLRQMSHIELVEWIKSQRDVAPQVIALLNESFPAASATLPELRALESAKAEVEQTQKMLGPMLDIPEVQSQYMFRMLAALIIGIALTEDIQARRQEQEEAVSVVETTPQPDAQAEVDEDQEVGGRPDAAPPSWDEFGLAARQEDDPKEDPPE
ncbi:XRE family transcriptional regulator [Mycobacterium paragordonae]|nr:XRE family transcriptional regulator [Mycobacterium paragordonae]